jgi:hypothetical protein
MSEPVHNPNTGLKSTNVNYLSLFLPNKHALYELLAVEQRYYLPDEMSRCISEKYLLGVAKGDYFRKKIEEIKYYFGPVNATAAKLYEVLFNKVETNLGFDIETLPNKKWLADVLYTIDPKNVIFNHPIEETTREFPIQ